MKNLRKQKKEVQESLCVIENQEISLQKKWLRTQGLVSKCSDSSPYTSISFFATYATWDKQLDLTGL